MAYNPNPREALEDIPDDPFPGPGPGPAPAPAPDPEPAPGPAPAPGDDQTGDPVRPPRNRPVPPPPPPPTAVEGVEASDVTGGVRGSFGQAGTREFSQRFGTGRPADWYRRTNASLGPDVRQQQQVARSGGGATGDLSGTEGEVGPESEEDIQKILALVQQNMFQGR